MAVRNRALSLALAGFLTGNAVSLATDGFIQVDEVSAVQTSDSTHRHTVDVVDLSQLHYVVVSDSTHRFVSAPMRWPTPVVPPVPEVRPDYGSPAVYRPFDLELEKELLDQLEKLDYTFESELKLKLISLSEWSHFIQWPEYVRHVSDGNLLIESYGYASQRLNASLDETSVIALHSDSVSEFTTPFRQTGIMPIGLRGQSVFKQFIPEHYKTVQTHTLTLHGLATVNQIQPSFYRHGVIHDIGLTGEAQWYGLEEIVKPEPLTQQLDLELPVKPEYHNFTSYSFIAWRSDTESYFTEQPVSSYRFQSDSSIGLGGEAVYQLSATARKLLRYGAWGSPVLSGSAHYALIPHVDTKHDEDDALILALADYLLSED